MYLIVTHTLYDSPLQGIMAASNGKKRGLEHLDEYEPKPAKHLRSLHDRMAEKRLVVILEGASVETVKVRRQRLCVVVMQPVPAKAGKDICSHSAELNTRYHCISVCCMFPRSVRHLNC